MSTVPLFRSPARRFLTIIPPGGAACSLASIHGPDGPIAGMVYADPLHPRSHQTTGRRARPDSHQ